MGVDVDVDVDVDVLRYIHTWIHTHMSSTLVMLVYHVCQPCCCCMQAIQLSMCWAQSCLPQALRNQTLQVVMGPTSAGNITMAPAGE